MIRISKRKGRIAKGASRIAYRKAIKMPKRRLAKKYANTVGQIAFRTGRKKPLHTRTAYKKGRRFLRKRPLKRRSFKRSYKRRMRY